LEKIEFSEADKEFNPTSYTDDWSVMSGRTFYQFFINQEEINIPMQTQLVEELF